MNASRPVTRPPVTAPPVAARPVIATRGLTKQYGDVLAVDALDLEVLEGDVFGFLGANGSGKTTTVRMLLGLVLATRGEIEVLGRPMPQAAHDVLPSVGCLVEGPAAYSHLSGRANLRLFDAAGPSRGRGPRLSTRRARNARVDEALERVGMSRAADRLVRGYSLGMRQRLGLAAALLSSSGGPPRLLVLDEPTNGLDPQGIHEMRELLLDLNRQGTTVFLSSHLLAEVEQLCSRVAVLDRGRLVVQQDLAELRRPTGRTVVVTPDPEAAVSALNGEVVARDGESLIVRSPDPADLNARLVAAQVRVRELYPERRGLEQVVLDATSGSGDVR